MASSRTRPGCGGCRAARIGCSPCRPIWHPAARAVGIARRLDRAVARRRRSTACVVHRAVARVATGVMRGGDLAARPTRACASCAGCSTRRSSLIGRLRRALAVHGPRAALASLAARLGRDRRRDPRLRRAPDAGQLRRRRSCSRSRSRCGRRLGHLRGRLRRRRGRAAQLHGPAHAVRAADRDPQRAARRRDPAQRHARRSTRSALDVSVWLPPDADAERAVACAARRRPARRVASPRRRPRASGCRSAASACAPARAGRAHEAELRARCLRRLRAEGLLSRYAGLRSGAN